MYTFPSQEVGGASSQKPFSPKPSKNPDLFLPSFPKGDTSYSDFRDNNS